MFKVFKMTGQIDIWISSCSLDKQSRTAIIILFYNIFKFIIQKGNEIIYLTYKCLVWSLNFLYAHPIPTYILLLAVLPHLPLHFPGQTQNIPVEQIICCKVLWMLFLPRWNSSESVCKQFFCSLTGFGKFLILENK